MNKYNELWNRQLIVKMSIFIPGKLKYFCKIQMLPFIACGELSTFILGSIRRKLKGFMGIMDVSLNYVLQWYLRRKLYMRDIYRENLMNMN